MLLGLSDPVGPHRRSLHRLSYHRACCQHGAYFVACGCSNNYFYRRISSLPAPDGLSLIPPNCLCSTPGKRNSKPPLASVLSNSMATGRILSQTPLPWISAAVLRPGTPSQSQHRSVFVLFFLLTTLCSDISSPLDSSQQVLLPFHLRSL